MVFRHIRTLVPFTAVALALVGCSPAGTAPRTPPDGPDIGAPDVPWKGKTHNERQAFMGAHVEPHMRRLFQQWKPKAYGDFGCVTCHGKDMDAVDFKMPNSLYALSEKDTIAEAKDYDEDTTKFMLERVVPLFAKLLSEKGGVPGSDAGVTCFTCHPSE
jgi:hypothetical protein